MEEGSIIPEIKEAAKDDWRVALMAKLTEWTQDNEDHHFIPIIHAWDANNEKSS